MSTTKFVLSNLNCGACVKVSQMKIKKIPGVKNVDLQQHGGEADGVLEADREITIEEIQLSLSDTPYLVRTL